MAKQTFTTGQVLTAAQMTSLQQTAMGGGSTTAKTASYVLVAADAGTVVQMNSASATTITVNTALFAAGDTVQIQNVGAGVCTVTADTATVSTSAVLALKQYDAGSLYFNSTSAALFFAADAADNTSPLTTKGDLYGFSTLNARIPIGTNNQVLTADSAEALGLKWATPASGSTFVGALASTRAAQNVTNNTFTAVPLATEDYDTDSIHSTSVNNSRFTIPTGKGGKWLFYATAGFDSMPSGSIQVRFYKNGSSTGQSIFTGYSGSGVTSASISVVLTLAAADYIELMVFQNSGGTETLLVSGSEDFTFMGCSYLGA